MREVKIFQPGDRREAINNLYCHYCGNVNQWQMDVRMRHTIVVESNGIAVALDEQRAKKLLCAIERNVSRILYRSESTEKPLFKCANCGNAELDMHENAVETCYNLGCPGCFDCGSWIDEEYLRELCEACIKDNAGEVDEEHCFNMCPHFDYGLEQVRQHYAITLE